MQIVRFFYYLATSSIFLAIIKIISTFLSIVEGYMKHSDRIVCKFGGSSVADAAQFRKIKAIVESNAQRKIVVVSAPGKRNPKETKLTDLLYSVHDLASKGLDFMEPYGLIRERFLEIVQQLSLQSNIAEDLDNLERTLQQESDSLTLDFLVSRGEFLSARLMAEYLGAEFVDAYDLIEFSANHRVSAEGYEAIAKRLSEDKLYVVPGFYGKNHQGVLKTFSRGGSDISGAILANAVNAAVYENWTDVSGLLMADPRIVDHPKPMEYVSYREIRELAYSGANVFHDEAIAPCLEKDILVNIRNTNKPEDKGTIIGPTPEVSERTITGVAGRKDFALIYIEKGMMNKEKGFGRRVLSILEGHDINWEHSPTGIDSMSIIVDQHSLVEREDLLMEDLQNSLSPDQIQVFRDLALVATVGHGMTEKVGVAAKLCTALADNGVNIRVIDQGSSEINIIVGIQNADYEKAIRAIYKAFAEE
jgi:aspartate kinase